MVMPMALSASVGQKVLMSTRGAGGATRVVVSDIMWLRKKTDGKMESASSSPIVNAPSPK